MTAFTDTKIPSPHELLKQAYANKQAKNSAYSMRALARNMDVTGAYISQIFAGKRLPSFEHAQKMAQLLELSEQHRNLLMHSLLFHRSDNEEYRETIRHMFQSQLTLSLPLFQPSEIDKYVALTQWYHIAILDLLSCDDFRPDPAFIARRLGLTESTVNEALQRLIRLKMIISENGTWRKSKQHLLFSEKSARDYAMAYTNEMLTQARDFYRHRAANEDTGLRMFTGATFAADPEKVAAAKKFLMKPCKRLQH